MKWRVGTAKPNITQWTLHRRNIPKCFSRADRIGKQGGGRKKKKQLTPLSSSERKSGPSSSPSCCQKESTESTKCVAETFSPQFTFEETYSEYIQAKNTEQIREIVTKNLPSWLLLRVEYGSGDEVWRHVKPWTQWAEPWETSPEPATTARASTLQKTHIGTLNKVISTLWRNCYYTLLAISLICIKPLSKNVLLCEIKSVQCSSHIVLVYMVVLYSVSMSCFWDRGPVSLGLWAWGDKINCGNGAVVETPTQHKCTYYTEHTLYYITTFY